MIDFYELSSDDQVARIEAMARKAMQSWGVNVSKLELIKYRENAVFRVYADTGISLALRIHRPGYHCNDELRSEVQWISALYEFGVDVPMVVPTVNGELFCIVEHEAVPEPRQADLFEWIEGEQLGSLEQGIGRDQDTVRKIYRTVGEIAARLHNQATGWNLPDGFKRHAWDADGLVGEQPVWGRFWELEALTSQQLDLIQRARRKLRADLTDYGKDPDHYSMIHADFVFENLMVHGDRVRLIDFDDAGFGWHLFELATILFFIEDRHTYTNAYDSLVEGYRQHRSLSDDQLSYLPLFILARSFTYLGWVHTRPETQTAREMTKALIDRACTLAETYLST